MNEALNEQETWLITGGLGYIGAHVAREFLTAGRKVLILDNLSTGFIERLPPGADFILGDCRNSEVINDACRRYGVTGVVHMAAFKHARESKLFPAKYFSNNVGGTLGLVEGLGNTSVRRLIFSSSCSIYGSGIVNDQSTPDPQSPYAQSKLMCEMILRDSLTSLNVDFVALRFFNVVGCADFDYSSDQSEECLIPALSRNLTQGSPIEIFGTDLPTSDGTCERDYLDVQDVAAAHSLLAEKVSWEGFPKSLNLSSGVPTSVREIVKEFESALQREIEIVSRKRNFADPVSIWAEPSRVLVSLGWNPRFSIRESIAAHLRQVSIKQDFQ